MVSEPIFRPPLPLPPEAAGKTILAYTHLPESTAIRIFINGLPPDLQGFVRFFNPSRLSAAICFADIQERYGPKSTLPQDSVANDDDQDQGELRVQDTDSNRIQRDEYGGLEQTESKILNDADSKRTEDESDMVLNPTVEVGDKYEVHDLKVDEADRVVANVKLIKDVIVEEEKCARINIWSKFQGTQDLLNQEGHDKHDVQKEVVDNTTIYKTSKIMKQEERGGLEEEFKIQRAIDRKLDESRTSHAMVTFVALEAEEKRSSLLATKSSLEGNLALINHQLARHPKIHAKFFRNGNFIWHRWKLRPIDIEGTTKVHWKKLQLDSQLVDKGKDFVAEKIADVKKPEADDVDFKGVSKDCVEYLARVSFSNPYSSSIPICEISHSVKSAGREIAKSDTQMLISEKPDFFFFPIDLTSLGHCVRVVVQLAPINQVYYFNLLTHA